MGLCEGEIWIVDYGDFHIIFMGGKILGRLTEILYNVLNSNSISTRASIGKNTVFYHHGLGCVIHRNCVIGDNCKVFGNVTIGCKWSNGE